MTNDEIQMSNIIDDNKTFEQESISMNSTTKARNVRLIYCGDGIVEECEEDEKEKERLEIEEKQRQIELEKKRDLEAKNLQWLPWFGYMAVKSATKSFEACDYMGEKLAWWLGITKPKFLYEIEEYNRMKKEREELNEDDIAEEIVIGMDQKNKTHLNSNQDIDEYKSLNSSTSLFPSNKPSSVLSSKLFQNE